MTTTPFPNHSFPIYILMLEKEGDADAPPEIETVFPEGRVDIGHPEFWEQTVAAIVADYYLLPLPEISALPYSQRRARIYQNRIYYGEEQDKDLLKAIRQKLGNDELAFFYDDHERRLVVDVLQFEALRHLAID